MQREQPFSSTSDAEFFLQANYGGEWEVWDLGNMEWAIYYVGPRNYSLARVIALALTPTALRGIADEVMKEHEDA